MKMIGLIGGMSWESSLEYYRLINEAVKERLGGLHSAKCVLYSVDFGDIEKMLAGGDWAGLEACLGEAGLSLKGSGADFLLICTNTMHKLAEKVEERAGIPLLHIADAAAAEIRAAGLKKVGLLGTKFTMEEAFYRKRLEERFGIEVLIPGAGDRDFINSVIFNELCLGVKNEASRARFREIIGNLVSGGAEGIVLGCTEIPLLVGQEDAKVPLFDTTKLHALAAVEFALK
ncbi:aspartate/glutamate racemase family protein [Methanosarcina sp. KYL-1]|uniref:aspartate/glutamate racemase family protein n=1 Tax=Methanosarcina sp. KYL-1 TaxID=2602068 RepID=UPI002100FD90|nr:aspartate/glutamate racemase family protein [Methanosarcina sp. KYL-1]MCQ1536329.1 aspartate/glutamate racemase family protein [Methanosarcina sp. KYL-1]